MSYLFSPLKIREVEFRNRIFVSPMCQYQSRDGVANDWHLVHLGSRAVGGAGAVVVEATAVSPEGRISPGDLGLWSPAQAESLKRVTDFIKSHGAAAGIQLAHAGRKASACVPWQGRGALPAGGWQPLAPSAIAFAKDYALPRQMQSADIQKLIGDFQTSTRLAEQAGFQFVELHMAHGYLLHEFLSPLSNRREDEYGGDFHQRIRIPLAVARAVREVWPSHLPLFVRLSCTDWVEKGWDLEQSVEFVQLLKAEGVDLVDCSSGGLIPDASIPVGPGYQVPFSREIRSRVQLRTAAVGCIAEPTQAEAILKNEEADAIFLAREMLRDPYWPLHAATQLKARVSWPQSYRVVQPEL